VTVERLPKSVPCFLRGRAKGSPLPARFSVSSMACAAPIFDRRIQRLRLRLHAARASSIAAPNCFRFRAPAFPAAASAIFSQKIR
jgi:hypothetical protein